MRRSLALALLLAVALVACAPAAKPTAESPPGPAPAAGGQSAHPASEGLAGQPANAPAPSADGQLSQALPPVPAVLDRLLIRTITLTLGVEDVQASFHAVGRIAAEAGGMVTKASFNQEGERQMATITIRVPPDEATVNRTLAQLRALVGERGRILDESVSSNDVTEEYSDLEAQLRALRATEARLLALLEKAQRLEEILPLERELTNLRTQIDRLEGRRRLLERQTALATITVVLRELGALERPSGGWDPRRVFQEAAQALGWTLRDLLTVLIWLVVWLPVYAVPIAIFWWLRRRLTRRPAAP